MTDEEYIEMCAERARKEAKDVLEHYLRPFEWVKDYFCTNNMSQEEFDSIMKEMCNDPNKTKD